MSESKLEPVFDDSGELILYDVFFRGKWYGSRRLKEQAEAYLAYLERMDTRE